MIIADTNVVSEFMRHAPAPGVLAWAATLEPTDLTICVVTVEEIERGLRRLPSGRRRRDLETRWGTLVDTFADAVVTYDVAAARQTASILVAAQAAGRRMSLADAQIAGICVSGGHNLATGNVGDFSSVAGLSVINPLEQEP